MARNRTQIEGTDFVKIAQNLGLDIVTNKGYTKCYRPGSRKIGVGIPNTKLVTRIEFVGFEHPTAGMTYEGKPPAGTVKQELLWTGDRRTTLQCFYQACAEGLLGATLTASVPASPPPPRKSKEELIAEFMAEFSEEPEALVGCA